MPFSREAHPQAPAPWPALRLTLSADRRAAPPGGSTHLVEQVAELVLLGLQVAAVVEVGRDLDGHALDDAQAVAVDADDLLGVVGEDAQLADAQVVEDLGADAVVPQVGAEAEAVVGLDGVEALLLL